RWSLAFNKRWPGTLISKSVLVMETSPTNGLDGDMEAAEAWQIIWLGSHKRMLDFAQFEWLSFDCYGTLIDWETGLLEYLRPLLASKGQRLSDAEILNLYSEFEPRAQS